MSKLATIQKVHNIETIKGADRIEVISVLGWKLVSSKGTFKVGDLCIYIAIDSKVPSANPHFDFLKDYNFRVKTIKMRGQISQGLALPMIALANEDKEAPEVFEGDDVTKWLGIEKYEKPIPECMSGQMKGDFPAFLSKTDEERIQNIPELLTTPEIRDLTFVMTEKLDGTAHTDYRNDGEYGVCSRNIDFLDTPGNLHWKLSKEMEVEDKLKSLGLNLALQGEVVGPSTQVKYGLKEHKLFYFDAFDIDTHEYYLPLTFLALMKELQLPTVPVIDLHYRLPDTLEELLAYADGYSLLDPKQRREGTVGRSVEEHNLTSLGGRLSFKVVSNMFLQKHE